MKKFHAIFLSFAVAGCAATPRLAVPPAVAPRLAATAPPWVHLGSDGVAEVRQVVETGGLCPSFASANGAIALHPRAPADSNFALLCSAVLPTDAAIPGLPAVKASPQRIVIVGDTGCRLKDETLQSCNDPKAWPFPSVAAAAARLRPDLVIDVGDYLYRETPCPEGNANCAGSPYGDNWPAWKADFLGPAAPLLTAAPWIFARGNHEECVRAGAGFLRLLGPLPYASGCTKHLAPFSVPLGDFTLMMMDDADASDTHVDPAHVAVYQAELAEANKASPAPVWLILHRPIWAAITGPLGIPIGGNAQIIASAEKTMLTKPVTLMLSGHIHSFEALNYAHDGVAGTPPPQIVAGNGGDNLDITPANLKGTIFQGHSGVTVKDGVSVGGFGFLLLTRSTTGWTIDLYDSAGTAEGQCLFTAASDRLDCPKLPRG